MTAVPDVIVIGAGTLGGVLATALDRHRGQRVLVLESAPSIEKSWGSPWPADTPCVSPVFDRNSWSAATARELSERYLPAATELLGIDRLWPQFTGWLNTGLRDRLRSAVDSGQLPGTRPARRMPDHPARHAGHDRSTRLGLRLHLPLAMTVTGEPDDPRPVRFSSAALLARCLRYSPDVTLLPDCHVIHLRTANGRVTGLVTSRGEIPVPDGVRVVLAAGTVENTRLVLDSAGDDPLAAAAGHGLTGHLRSTLTVRLPFPEPPNGTEDGGAAALLVQGRHRGARFHHQITAHGIAAVPATALVAAGPVVVREAEPPRQLVITVASVAEMTGHRAGGVRLGTETDEFGARRAEVRLAAGKADLRTWDHVDRCADRVVETLAAGRPYETLTDDGFVSRPAGTVGPAERREPLDRGRHEMGTLRMGDRPSNSATDRNGRLWALRNTYVAGAAAFPALCSAGPVLPGVALTLRLADHLATRG